jgi:NADH-quinone oxidoreductase subunit C
MLGTLKNDLKDYDIKEAFGELTLEISPKELDELHPLFIKLRDDPRFLFEELMDVCGVDYLHYGMDEWSTTHATHQGFERAVRPISDINPNSKWTKPRLAVVYHLLSLSKNQRLRVKVFLPDNDPTLLSVTSIWKSANWYEREAFDLYGILFEAHPDLRRILTDYGFIGHPFRKDFPLIGNVEVRFDNAQNRVIYEPVTSVTPRVLVPKVIRGK